MAADPCLLLSLKEQNDVSIMAEVSDPGMTALHWLLSVSSSQRSHCES